MNGSGENLGAVNVSVGLAWEKMERQLSSELPSRMRRVGRVGADALLKELEARFRRDIGDAKEALARGLIDEQEFEKQARAAAKRFNDTILKRVEELATSGQKADGEISRLTASIKLAGIESEKTGKKGLAAFLSWRNAIKGTAAIIIAGAILRGLQRMARAALNLARDGEELVRSFLKLSASARLFGVDLEDLTKLSQDARREYSLTIRESNALATVTSKLASQSLPRQTAAAEKAARAQELLAAALDLGAAQGLSAAETGQALEQTLRGQEEGLRKLLQKTPSQVYEDWARANGKAASSLTDVQQKQALVDAVLASGERVRGAYANFLESDVGRLTAWRAALQGAREEIGTKRAHPHRRSAGRDPRSTAPWRAWSPASRPSRARRKSAGAVTSSGS